MLAMDTGHGGMTGSRTFLVSVQGGGDGKREAEQFATQWTAKRHVSHCPSPRQTEAALCRAAISLCPPRSTSTSTTRRQLSRSFLFSHTAYLARRRTRLHHLLAEAPIRI